MMLITTLIVSFLVFCMLEVRCGLAGVVSGLQALACSRCNVCDHRNRNYNSFLVSKFVTINLPLQVQMDLTS